MFVGMAAEDHLAASIDKWLHPEFLAESRVAAVTGGPCAWVVAREPAQGDVAEGDEVGG